MSKLDKLIRDMLPTSKPVVTSTHYRLSKFNKNLSRCLDSVRIEATSEDIISVWFNKGSPSVNLFVKKFRFDQVGGLQYDKEFTAVKVRPEQIVAELQEINEFFAERGYE